MKIITSLDLAPSRQASTPISIGLLSSSPIGPLWVALSDLGIVALDWGKTTADLLRQLQERFHAKVRYDEHRASTPLLQVSEYLAGHRRQFDLTLDLTSMSLFQLHVLQFTLEIPYGQTSTYKEIATRMDKPRAARAVGRVEATNPIPLIIPCHRVIGSDGKLHGYGWPGGIKIKAWLLKLEEA